ncbi:MAG: response regulator transcription factor [Woeseiaceae bacterium]
MWRSSPTNNQSINPVLREESLGETLRIAMLEDDPDQAELVALWLENAGHTVSCHAAGNDFLRAVRRDSFDAYVLDWLVPDLSGIDVLRKLRTEQQDNTPTIITTVKDEERSVVRALREGADDYVVKPIRHAELLARLDAICRRTTGDRSANDGVETDPYAMDMSRKIALLDGKEISLTSREFDLAMFLFRNAGKVVSRGHILEAIWGIEYENVSTRTVDTHISRLRKKMKINKDNGWHLTSVYQHGYRFEKIGATD